MNTVPWRRFAGLMLVVIAVVTAGCAASGGEDEYRPRAATRIVILTPVPTSPPVPTIVAGATVAPQPTPGPSAQAPTPPSAEGVATEQVEIGEITRVPILENTPRPAEVGTVTLSGSREGEEVAPETPTPEANQTATGPGSGNETGTPQPEGAPPPAGAGTPQAGGARPTESDRTPTVEGAAGTNDAAGPTALVGEAGSTPEASAAGLQVYRSVCAACHGVAGQGGGDFPRLDGNQVVRGDPELVIQTVLSGRGMMPAWRDQLSDEQIAAVVTYIRSAWSNDAPGVTPQMVADQRNLLP